MPHLTHVTTETPSSHILEIIERDGAVIIDAILSPDETAQFSDELAPLLKELQMVCSVNFLRRCSFL